MQIFLPFANFRKSLECLDNKRLGKQRVEAFQVYMLLTRDAASNSHWLRHPVLKMWRGYELALRHYIIECCSVWITRKTKDGSRFFSNAKMDENIETYKIRLSAQEQKRMQLPPFIGLDRFHDSHKAMLFHKGKLRSESTNHYEQFHDYAHITGYYWPVPPDATSTDLVTIKSRKRRTAAGDDSDAAAEYTTKKRTRNTKI